MTHNQEVAYPTNQQVFAKRLTVLMREKHITQQALATVLSKKRQTISLYCTGQSTPNADTVAAIARYLQVPTEYLLGLSEDKNYRPVLAHQLGLSQQAIDILRNYSLQAAEQGEGGLCPVTVFIDEIIRFIGSDEFERAYQSYKQLCAVIVHERQSQDRIKNNQQILEEKARFKGEQDFQDEKDRIRWEEESDLLSIRDGAEMYGYTLASGRDMAAIYAHKIGVSFERLFEQKLDTIYNNDDEE